MMRMMSNCDELEFCLKSLCLLLLQMAHDKHALAPFFFFLTLPLCCLSPFPEQQMSPLALSLTPNLQL